MWLEGLQLTCLICIVESIVVQSAFTDGDDFSRRCICYELINLLKVLRQHCLSFLRWNYSSVLATLRKSRLVWFECATGMYSNCCVEMLALHTQIETNFCIFDKSCREKELLHSEQIGALNALVEIRFMHFPSSIVLTLSVLITGHVCSNIKELMLLPIRLCLIKIKCGLLCRFLVLWFLFLLFLFTCSLFLAFCTFLLLLFLWLCCLFYSSIFLKLLSLSIN